MSKINFDQGGLGSFITAGKESQQERKAEEREKERKKTEESVLVKEEKKQERKEPVVEKRLEEITEEEKERPERKTKPEPEAEIFDINPDMSDAEMAMALYNIMHPYMTQKRSRQNRDQKVSFVVTEKAKYALDRMEDLTGNNKNFIVNLLFEKMADKLGYEKNEEEK